MIPCFEFSHALSCNSIGTGTMRRLPPRRRLLPPAWYPRSRLPLGRLASRDRRSGVPMPAVCSFAGAMLALGLCTPVAARGEILEPQKYEYVGPFPMGKTELDGDPLQVFGGARALFAQHEAQPSKKVRFISELATGGYVGWSTLRAQQGAVDVSPRRVDWNRLVQGLSGRGVLEFQGWLFGRVAITRAGRYLAACEGVTQFELDGQLLTGDVYRTGRGWWPVDLAEGEHLFQLRPRGVPPLRVGCHVKPAPAPQSSLVLQSPPFLPDVFEKALFGGAAPLPMPGLYASS